MMTEKARSTASTMPQYSPRNTRQTASSSTVGNGDETLSSNMPVSWCHNSRVYGGSSALLPAPYAPTAKGLLRKGKATEGLATNSPHQPSRRLRRRLTTRWDQKNSNEDDDEDDDSSFVASNGSRKRRRKRLPDIAKRVPVDTLRGYMKMPLEDAAKDLGISSTTLKRLCRQYGVHRWPYRQISGIDRMIERLESELQFSFQHSPADAMVCENGIAAHIRELRLQRREIVELTLEGGHDSIRGKLGFTGDFIDNEMDELPESVPAPASSSPAIVQQSLESTPPPAYQALATLLATVVANEDDDEDDEDDNYEPSSNAAALLRAIIS